jgi:hypothetical protein
MGRSLTPLSPNEQSALDHLELCGDEDTVVRARAVEQLIDAGFVAPAARDLIERLCEKGHLSEIDDGLRLTNSS